MSGTDHLFWGASSAMIPCSRRTAYIDHPGVSFSHLRSGIGLRNISSPCSNWTCSNRCQMHPSVGSLSTKSNELHSSRRIDPVPLAEPGRLTRPTTRSRSALGLYSLSRAVGRTHWDLGRRCTAMHHTLHQTTVRASYLQDGRRKLDGREFCPIASILSLARVILKTAQVPDTDWTCFEIVRKVKLP